MSEYNKEIARGIAEELGLNEDQNVIFHKLVDGKNVYLAGNAGTGKSYLVKAFIRYCEDTKCKLLKSASTGIAAVNIGGVTVHSLFKLSGDDLQTANLVKPVKSVPEKVKEILKLAQTLLIDEISMLRMDLFDKVMTYVFLENQTRMRQGRMPIQLVFVGDFFQLAPVVKKDVDDKILKEAYGRDVGFAYCFQSKFWQAMDMQHCTLTEIVRQTDEDFCKALDQCKMGDSTCLEFFANRTAKEEIPDAVWLYGKNKSAFEKNQECLKKLESPLCCFEAEYSGDAVKEDGICEDKLWLKVGARILMTANDTNHRYYNGSMGTIIKFSGDSIIVEIDDDKAQGYVSVERKTYEKRDYKEKTVIETITNPDGTVSKKKTTELVLETTGKAEQFPMKLGYAITIHKSQGQTYEAMNLSPEIFAVGQLYVALSRCKSAEKMYIAAPLTNKMLLTSKQVVAYYESPDTYSFFGSGENMVNVPVPQKHKAIVERVLKAIAGREDEFAKVLRKFENSREGREDGIQLSLLEDVS